MVIADGHHLPAELVSIFAKVKGREGVILTSDIAPVAGLPPGRYECFSTVRLGWQRQSANHHAHTNVLVHRRSESTKRAVCGKSVRPT